MKRVLIIVLILAVGTVGYCQVAYPTYTWHQKMILEVEVNGQVYTGSSVVEVVVKEQVLKFGFPFSHHARGEATLVELPQKRYLFALLSGGPFNSKVTVNAFNIFKDQSHLRGIERYAEISKSRFKEEISSPSHYPLLVTFRDINDPATVQKVDPGNLAETLGRESD